MALEQKKVYLLLGSNMGDRFQMSRAATGEIEKRVGKLLASSSFYETAAWGKEDQESFINQAMVLQTELSAEAVLEIVLDIELELGRERLEHWGARLIDIDLIFFESEVINIPDKLIIPHPQLQYRRFVLEPLSEIAGQFVHPILQLSVSDILTSLPDKLSVSKINL